MVAAGSVPGPGTGLSGRTVEVALAAPRSGIAASGVHASAFAFRFRLLAPLSPEHRIRPCGRPDPSQPPGQTATACRLRRISGSGCPAPAGRGWTGSRSWRAPPRWLATTRIGVLRCRRSAAAAYGSRGRGRPSAHVALTARELQVLAGHGRCKSNAYSSAWTFRVRRHGEDSTRGACSQARRAAQRAKAVASGFRTVPWWDLWREGVWKGGVG